MIDLWLEDMEEMRKTAAGNAINIGVTCDETDTEKGKNQEEVPPDEIWVDEISGAVVVFGPGAVVRNIVFPSEFSAIRLCGLHCSDTPKSVVTLVRALLQAEPSIPSLADFVWEENIYIRHPRNVVSSKEAADQLLHDAVIYVPEPTFATHVCTAVTRPEHMNAVRVFVEPVDVRFVVKAVAELDTVETVRTGIGSVESKSVRIIWYKKTKPVWLHYHDEPAASYIASRFNNGKFTICGERCVA
ncbi:hypothetical protein SEUCBS140593_010543, partial [Sporothrix eucalyptigena]